MTSPRRASARFDPRLALTIAALTAGFVTPRFAAAQATPQPAPKPQQPEIKRAGFFENIENGDVIETVLFGGVELIVGGMQVRAERAVLVADNGGWLSAAPMAQRADGLPRRGFEPAASRRKITPELLRERLRRFVSAFERRPRREVVGPEIDLELLRSAYLEGGVSFIQDGREVVRAERLFLSVIDDRAVFEDVVLRFFRQDPGKPEQVVVVRAPKITRQNGRFVGQDLSVTSCSAGKPHFEVLSGECEIIDRENEFEIRSRDNWLAFSGREVVPLPDVTHFTGRPIDYIVQGGSAGYSRQLGITTNLALGGPMNDVGGAVHEALTGRPASEFRGLWGIDAGWIQERGFPLEGRLAYEAEGLYRGQSRFFTLDDHGEDIRELQLNVDGTPIMNRDRQLLHSENRVWLNRDTTLDLTAFWARDPAVYSEFFNREWVENELPETSLHFRHQAENYSFQTIGRFNLADFAYGSSRALMPSFVETKPVVSFDLIAEPIAELWEGAPLQLTSATSIGRFERDFDPRAASPVDDGTNRFDQEIELAVPFRAGAFGVRAFAGGQFTNFSNTVSGSSRDRFAFTAGASIGTRLSRVWRWQDADGETAVRHVMSPTVRVEHRFKVDGEPDAFHQFDRIDALDEGANIRVGLLQRVQRRRSAARAAATDSNEEAATTAPVDSVDELVWLDLAQNFAPISDRDNGGHHLGLGEFELIVRPASDWFPLDRFAFVVEGEHDWDRSELRTFNTYATFAAFGPQWFVGYRADQTARGVVGYGAELDVRGRWSLGFATDYDLEREETLVERASLVRRDHDWQFIVGVARNRVIDDVSFTVDFVPDFGGIFRQQTTIGLAGDNFRGLRYPEYLTRMPERREFPDHFSDRAAGYARFRPTYPASLFEQLAALPRTRARCWDCGSGQAAIALAAHFDEVIGTDASARQLEEATRHANVLYVTARAEDVPLDNASCDLITVASALHWFEHDAFYAEVRRVARHGAVLAAWGYGARVTIAPEVDALIDDFADVTIGPDWPPQFHHNRSRYRELPFPFERFDFAAPDAQAHCSLDDILGYLRTWSGVRAHERRTGIDPVLAFGRALRAAWPADPTERLLARWPVHSLVGVIDSSLDY